MSRKQSDEVEEIRRHYDIWQKKPESERPLWHIDIGILLTWINQLDDTLQKEGL